MTDKKAQLQELSDLVGANPSFNPSLSSGFRPGQLIRLIKQIQAYEKPEKLQLRGTRPPKQIKPSENRTCYRAKLSAYIYEASNYYNKSLVYTQKARSDLDTVLYEYRKVPHVQELIGLGENKTWFYYFHLGNINNILRSNNRALTEVCKTRVVKN